MDRRTFLLALGGSAAAAFYARHAGSAAGAVESPPRETLNGPGAQVPRESQPASVERLTTDYGAAQAPK